MTPSRFLDDEAIETLLSEPLQGVTETVAGLGGDFIVLGVGGKMGTTAARMLRRAVALAGLKARVIGVSRFSKAEKREALEAHGVETVSCDLADPEAVAALPAAANVLFLAGQKFGTDAAPETTWIQNVVVPAHVARRFKQSRMVVFSTGCVYPFSRVDGSGCREADATALLGEYAASCVGRERVFAHYANQFATRVLLFRLNYAVELRYGVLVDMAVRIVNGEPIDVTMGHLNLIWQGDAVARAIRGLNLAESPARTLNVTGPEVLRVRDLALGLGQRLGRMPRFTGMEAEMAWLADATASMRLFGPPTVTLDTILDHVANHIGGGGAVLGKPTHFEARDGKF